MNMQANVAPDQPKRRACPVSSATLAALLGGAGVCAMIVLVATDVSLRAVINEPLSWSVEVATYLMAVIALFGLAWAERYDAHIRVEFILDRLPTTARCSVERAGRWLAIVLVFVAVWTGTEFCYNAWANGQRAFGIIETPLWIPQLSLGLAFALLAVELLRRNLFADDEPQSRRSVRTTATVVVLLFAAAACLAWRTHTFTAFSVSMPLPLLVIVVAVTLLAGLRSAKESAVFVIIALAFFAFGLSQRGSPPLEQGLAIGVLMCVLLIVGVQIGYTLGLCALWGLLFLLPVGQISALPERVWAATTSFELTAVPAFVLMGVLLVRSGITARVFAVLAVRLRALPGSLAYASVVGCAIFSTVSGSSMATAVMMGTVACPEMLKRGYDRRVALGAVAAGGTLGILIPPSIAMIIYGSVVGVSVTALFTAGFLPGLLLVSLFCAIIAVWTWRVPPQKSAASATTEVSRADALRIAGFASLIFIVLGSIYAGFATPTEAGAVGAIGALLICWAMRTLSFRTIRDSLVETLQATALLMLIVAFAASLSYVIDFLRMPKLIVDLMKPLIGQPLWFFIALCALYTVLGMFIETVSMILITLPIVFPMIIAAGFDPVWFGIVLVVLMEVSLLTPPVGMNLFVMRSIVPDSSLQEIAYGAMPFVGAMVVLLAALYVWPEIALWLPQSR